MKLEIGFGTTPQIVELPDKNVDGILYPNEVTATTTGAEEVNRSLSHPIGTRSLEEIVKGKERIVIVTSDITRPMPSHVVLPQLLERVYAAGVKPESITIVFALGSHRTQTEEEKLHLVGESVYRQVRCVDSSEFDFVHMGTTPGGTPVDICRPVAEADCRICLGNIEYHYFAGYSGGAKAIMPGVSTRAAIQANHSRMVRPDACAGKLEGNSLRKDLEDALVCCPVDFIVNVVLDETKQIVYSVCGDIITAHRAGCRFLDRFYRKEISRKADIVLVGSCREGMGERVFEEWMLRADRPSDLIKRIETDFQLGGHKAAAIAMVLEHAKVFLVSHMEEEFVRNIFMTPFSSVQEAVDQAFEELGAEASVLVMPFGGSTLPVVGDT